MLNHLDRFRYWVEDTYQDGNTRLFEFPQDIWRNIDDWEGGVLKTRWT